MRILVAIANHGTKNHRYLQMLLDSYRSMSHHVDLVVLSDVPKSLGPDVEVRVGAPTSNPWSLPFAHRQLFADRIDDYDLFLYTEDDTLVLERHIEVFLELDALLPDDEVPGFFRFELDEGGRRTISSIHSTYRWLPGSVDSRGGEVFADHTNLHAACYLLTRQHLRRAIASGGYLVAPHEGLFDMLVSAAVDPYVQCGLRRRICVTRIEEVLLHHLPNVYVGEYGATQRELDAQVGALLKIAVGELTRDELVTPETSLPTHIWDALMHSRPSAALRELAPDRPRRVLSVGTGSGVTEVAAFPDADEIVAIPFDAVIGSVAATRGLRVLAPELDELEEQFSPGSCDVVLLHNNLHLFAHPASLLTRLRRVAAPDAVVLVTQLNTPYFALRRTMRRRHAAPVPTRDHATDGAYAPGAAFLRRLERQGVVTWDTMRFARSDRVARLGSAVPPMVDRWLARKVVARGHLPG